MPLLSREELVDMAAQAVHAAALNDGELVIEALKPLRKPTGDVGDGWLLTSMLVNIVADDLPRPECSDCHDPDCVTLTFGLVGVGKDGRPNWDDRRGVTPEFEEAHPGQVAYLRMLTAEFNGDLSASMDVFCVAVKNGYAPDLIWIAVQNAGQAYRRSQASLQ